MTFPQVNKMTDDVKIRRYIITIEVTADAKIKPPIDAVLFEWIFSNEFPGVVERSEIKEVNHASNHRKIIRRKK